MVRRRKRETAKEAQSGKEAEDGEGSAKRRRKRRRRLDGAPTMGKVVKGLQQLDRDGRLRALEEHVRSVGGYAQAVCALTDLLKKQDWRVRHAVVEALSEIAVTVVRELTRRLVFEPGDVWSAWLRALSGIAEKGDKHGLDAASIFTDRGRR